MGLNVSSSTWGAVELSPRSVLRPHVSFELVFDDGFTVMMAALQVNVHSYLFGKCILKPFFLHFWKAFPKLDIRVKKGEILSLYPN